jgi:hypothetical protein
LLETQAVSPDELKPLKSQPPRKSFSFLATTRPASCCELATTRRPQGRENILLLGRGKACVGATSVDNHPGLVNIRLDKQAIWVLTPLAVLLCVGTLGYWIARGAKQKAILFRQETLRALDYSADLNSYQAEGFGRLMLQIETDDPQRREAYHAEGVAYRDKIDQILKSYGATISPDQVEARRAFDSFVQTRE